MGVFDSESTKVRKAIKTATQARDIAGLEKTVARARKAKLPAGEIEAVERTVAQFNAEDRARALLRKALAVPNLQNLREAVQSGDAARLGEAEMTSARRLLNEEEARLAARDHVAKALAETGSEDLNKAISEAYAAGIPENQLVEALRVVEIRRIAEEKVAEAIKIFDIPGLEAAIAHAEKDGAGNLEAGKTALEQAKECQALLPILAAAIAHPLDLERISKLRVAVRRAKAATGFDAEKLSDGEAALFEEEKRDAARVLFRDAHKVQDAAGVKQAIELAKAAAIPTEELAPWESALVEDTKYTEAKQALGNRGVPELKAAIIRARAAGVDEAEVTAAEKQVVERESALSALMEALKTRGVEQLKPTVESATTAGCSDEEISIGVKQLKDREEASVLIAQGLQSRDLEVLTKAYELIAVALVLEEDEQQCRKVYTEEKGKADARDAIKAARDAKDHEALSVGIASAEAVGIGEKEVGPAREDQKAIQSIDEALQECQSSEDLGKIRSTLLQAQKMQLPDSMTLSCRIHLGRQEGLSSAATLITNTMKQADEAIEDARGPAIERLRQALARGDQLKLEESPSRAATYAEGKKMLLTVQKRLAACDAMAIAVKEREGASNVDPFKLRGAYAAATESGVSADECKACEKILHVEEQKYAALDAVQRSMEHRTEDVLNQFGACGANSLECIKDLTADIEYARKVGVPDVMLTDGSLAVDEEEEKCRAQAKIHDNNPETRQSQLEKLRAFVSKGHMDAATAVCGRLQDGDVGTRILAAEILGESPGNVDTGVVSALSVQAADDSNQTARCIMIASLAAIASRGCAKAATALALHLQNQCVAARVDAARGLGPVVTSGNNQLCALLCARLEVDPVAQVRREAVSALRFAAATGDPDVAAAIVMALDDGAEEVYQEAIKTLRNLQGPGRSAGIRALISRLTSGSYCAKRLRIEALSAIAPHGDYAPIEATQRLLQDRDASVRKAAGRALGVMAGPSAAEVLSKQLEDSNWGVRWAAVESLGEVMSALGPEKFLDRAQGSIYAVAFYLISTDPSIRLVAAEALGRVFEVGLRMAIGKLLPEPLDDLDDPPMSPMMRIPSRKGLTDSFQGTGGTGDTPAPAADSRIPIVYQWGAALEDDAPLRQETFDALMSLAGFKGVKESELGEMVDKRTITAVALRLEHGDLRVQHAAAQGLAKNEMQGSAAHHLTAQIRNGAWSVRRAICDVARHVTEFREDAVLKAEEAVPQVSNKLIARLIDVGL